MTDLSLSAPAPRSGYAAQRRRSPSALVAALALNGGAFALILALPATNYVMQRDKGLPVTFVDVDPVPPEVTPDPAPRDERVRTQPTIETHEAPPPPYTPPTSTFEGNDFVQGGGGAGTAVIGPTVEPPPPVHVPVLRPARQDPRFADSFHPDYPLSLQREGLEGSVTVRVTIDEKGRVIAVEMVKATDKAFFEETKTQALRHWRFLPATSDGNPVQSQQTLTVNFRLES